MYYKVVPNDAKIQSFLEEENLVREYGFSLRDIGEMSISKRRKYLYLMGLRNSRKVK